MLRSHLTLKPPYLVVLLVRRVAMRAGVAPSPALFVAKHRREERGKSFPFNGNECNVAEHLCEEMVRAVQTPWRRCRVAGHAQPVTTAALPQRRKGFLVATHRFFATRRGGSQGRKGFPVSRQLSVARILSQLEERIGHHQRQEAFHAQQKARHAAELAVARERYESFRVAADSAGELVTRPLEEPVVDDSIPSGKWAVLSRLIARVVATKGPIEPFGANAIGREIEERWGNRLKRRVDPRSVAAKLRRMARTGRIHQLRAGRAFHEA